MFSEFEKEYLKIAEKHGLITKDDYVDAHEELKKKQAAKDKDIEEQIALLYGVKPNGKEDDESMVEKAHPGVAVVFPAEDRMNGIVENLQQRQDILVEIANRPSNGKYQQKLFVTAYNDLARTLMKAATECDLNDAEELAVFADSCNEKLASEHETIVKEAFWPLLIAGVVAAIGGIAAINYSSNAAQDVVTNTEQAIDELEDLRDVFGHGLINDIVRDLYSLRLYAQKFSGLPKIKALSPEDIVNVQEKYKDELRVADSYRKVLIQAQRNIPMYIDQLRNYEASGEGESDWWHKMKYVIRIVTPDDRQDAINALEGLAEAVKNAIKSVDFYTKSAERYEPTVKEVFEKSIGSVSQTVESDEQPGSLSDIMPKV